MPVKKKTIRASLTVNVDEPKSGEGGLSAWIDDRPAPCGLNGGKTSFKPGDTYHFLVTKPANAENLRVTNVSVGSASISGKVVPVYKEDDLEFNDSSEATLSNSADSGFNADWSGASTCGDYVLQADKMTVSTKNKGDGSLLASYYTNAVAGQGIVPANYYQMKEEKPRLQIKIWLAAEVPDLGGTSC